MRLLRFIRVESLKDSNLIVEMNFRLSKTFQEELCSPSTAGKSSQAKNRNWHEEKTKKEGNSKEFTVIPLWGNFFIIFRFVFEFFRALLCRPFRPFSPPQHEKEKQRKVESVLSFVEG